MKVVSSSSERPNRNPSKVEVLKRIIDQEIASGYEDRAVIGGIDNFIRKWSSDISLLILRVTIFFSVVMHYWESVVRAACGIRKQKNLDK